MEQHIKTFAQWMQRLGYSERTIITSCQSLNQFIEWLEKQGINKLDQIDSRKIKQYHRHLQHRKNQVTKGGLSSRTIEGHFTTLHRFDKYLQLCEQCSLPVKDIEIANHLPIAYTILSQYEIQKLYGATDQSPYGYRDRAMLGIYYGCGLRLSEGLSLELDDIDLKRHLLQVRKGKGNKERFVPMNKKISEDITEYIHYGRSWFLENAYPSYKIKTEKLLISRRGSPSKASGITKSLQVLSDKAGINKIISPHDLRHSIATHLLQNGLPIEQIAQFLGHSTLESTQIYTHILHEQPPFDKFRVPP
jgi:integrase/recombinase XerD